MYRNIFLQIVGILLSMNGLAYDIVVAADGSGDFKTLQEAVLSVRDYTPEPKSIFVKNGLYQEKVVIPANKCDITIVGESVDSTIIRWDDHAKINNMGTFKTYTLLVSGNRIRLENLTIENDAPQLGQAVSLHVDGDEFVAKNCKLLGNQDTLFTGNENSCQLYLQCEIEGTTDFIFGPATCWFEDCVITSRKNSWITAASTPQTNAVGYVFNNCKIKAKEGVDKVFLGRPWRAYAAVVFMHCELGAQIDAAGWENWKNTEHDKTARYAEYQNTGAGAKSDSRVGFAKQLTKKEAKQLSMKKVFAGWSPKM